MSKSKHAKYIHKLITIKIREIRDGCLVCQGKKPDHNPVLGCEEHLELINDMILHPKKYAEELLKPGDVGNG